MQLNSKEIIKWPAEKEAKDPNRHLLPRGHTGGQQVRETRSTPQSSGRRNQNHNETPPRTCEGVRREKSKGHQCRGGRGGRGLVHCWRGSRCGRQLPQTTKSRTNIRPSDPASGHPPEGRGRGGRGTRQTRGEGGRRIRTSGYSPAVKKAATPPPVTTWRTPEGSMLSETSRSVTQDEYCVISLTRGARKSQSHSNEA